jgi:hypothetical protein
MSLAGIPTPDLAPNSINNRDRWSAVAAIWWKYGAKHPKMQTKAAGNSGKPRKKWTTALGATGSVKAIQLHRMKHNLVAKLSILCRQRATPASTGMEQAHIFSDAMQQFAATIRRSVTEIYRFGQSCSIFREIS